MSASRLLASEPQRALSALLQIVLPVLGTAQSTKCVVEGDDRLSTAFVKDAFVLLQSLHIEHPVGQMILEVCKAHKELHGCGVKSLLFFMGHLHKTAEGLRGEGVPLFCTEELLHEALEECVRELEKTAVPVRVQVDSEERTARSQPVSPYQASTRPHLMAKPLSASCTSVHNEQSSLGALISPKISQNVAVTSHLETSVNIPHSGVTASPGVVHVGSAAGVGAQMKSGHVNASQFQSSAIALQDSSQSSKVPSVLRTPGSSALPHVESSPVPSHELPKHSAFQTSSSLSNINQTLAALSLLPGKTPQTGSSLHKRVMQSSRHFGREDVEDKTESKKGYSMHTTQAVSENTGVDPNRSWKAEVLSSKDCTQLSSTASSIQIFHNQFCPRPSSTQMSGGCSGAKLVIENVSVERFFEDFGVQKENSCISYNAVTKGDRNQEYSTGHLSRHTDEDTRCGEVNCSGVEYARIASSTEPSSMFSELSVFSGVQADESISETQNKDISNLINTGCLSQFATAESGRKSQETTCSEVTLPKDSQCLSHGFEEAMNFASHMMSHQFLNEDRRDFDFNLLHTCCITGTSRSQEVVDGLVLSADQQAVETVSKRHDRTFSVLLVNGDLTPGAHHKGFKPTLDAKQIVSIEDLTEETRSWATDVVSVLDQLGVSAVLVKGRADPALRDLCVGKDVVVVEMVPYHALLVLQTACKAELTIYPLEATSNNVCSGLRLAPLHGHWMDKMSKENTHMVLKCPGVDVQTLVIQHPSPAWRDVLEQEFWACVNRLAQAVKDRMVLPGGGITEEFCGRYLSKNLNKESDENQVTPDENLALYRPMVRAALAETFTAYARVVQNNRLKADVGDMESITLESQRRPSGHAKESVPDLVSGRTGAKRQFDPITDRARFADFSQNSVSVRARFADFSQNSVSALGHAFVQDSQIPTNPRSSFLPLDNEIADFDDLFCGVTPLPSADDSPTKSQVQAGAKTVPSTNQQNGDSVSATSQENFESGSQTFGPNKIASLSLPDDEHTFQSYKPKHQHFEQNKGTNSVPKVDTRTTLQDFELDKRNDSSVGCDRGFLGKQCDNFKSKISAWRSAVSCVCMLMKLDMLIRTGVDKETAPTDSVLL